MRSSWTGRDYDNPHDRSPYPGPPPGASDVAEIRGLVLDARAVFEVDSSTAMLELELFRQALYAAIGDISPAEATAALAREAARLFHAKG